MRLSFLKIGIHTAIVTMFSIVTIVFYSCSGKISEIKQYAQDEKVPQLTMVDLEMDHFDNGHLQGRLRSPKMLRFDENFVSTTEFPDGLDISLYNDSLQPSGSIHADYALYHESSRLWEARRNVKVVNSTGETLTTEELFWDESTDKIYSGEPSKITNNEGVFYGEHGFSAFQQNGDFAGWALYSSKASLDVKNRASARDTITEESDVAQADTSPVPDRFKSRKVKLKPAPDTSRVDNRKQLRDDIRARRRTDVDPETLLKRRRN